MLAFDGSFALGHRLTCDESHHSDQLANGKRNQVADRWNFVPAFAIDHAPVPCNSYQACASEGRCPHQDGLLCKEHERALVDHQAAEVYCKQRGARLPTYLEWQRAVRGIRGDVYPRGDTWDRERDCFLPTETPGLPNAGRAPKPFGCQQTSFDGVVYHVVSRSDVEWTNDTACTPEGTDGPAGAYIADPELNQVTPTYRTGQFRCARSSWGIPQNEVGGVNPRGDL